MEKLSKAAIKDAVELAASLSVSLKGGTYEDMTKAEGMSSETFEVIDLQNSEYSIASSDGKLSSWVKASKTYKKTTVDLNPYFGRVNASKVKSKNMKRTLLPHNGKIVLVYA